MQIGQLSKATGFSKDTIRWYEKIGLITLNRNDRNENNYRNYSEIHLQQLLQIKQLKSFGFTLKDIEHLQLLDKHDLVDCSNVGKVVNERIEAIANKINALQLLEKKLKRLKESCSGNCKVAIDNIDKN